MEMSAKRAPVPAGFDGETLQGVRQPLAQPPAGTVIALEEEVRTRNELEREKLEDLSGVLDTDILSYAEDRIGELERRFLKMSPLVAGLTAELFKEDQVKFEKDSFVAQSCLADIRALLIRSRVLVERQFPRIGFVQKIRLWFASFLVRGLWENIRRQILTRRAYLGALNRYDALCEEYLAKIENIRLLPYRPRQIEILNRSVKYQELVAELERAQIDLARREADPNDSSIREEAVRKTVEILLERKADMERNALWQSMGREFEE